MDKQTALIMIFAFPLGALVWIGLFMWFFGKMQRKGDHPLSPATADARVIPVRNLKRAGRFLGYAQNSIGPRLEVATDGLRFKLFKAEHWPFTDIARVDIFPLPIITRLEVRSQSGGRLFIDVADKAAARDFLRALPGNLPLTPRAVARRDEE